MMIALHKSKWRSLLRRVFLHMVFFLAVGPIVSVPIAFLLALFFEPDSFMGTAKEIENIISAIPRAYLTLGLVAALTGTVVGTLSTWVRKSLWLCLIAALTGGALSIANFIIVWPRVPDDPVIGYFLIGAVFAVICTALTKRFRVSTQAVSDKSEPHPETSA